jgi:hypothetical protein
MTMYVPRLVKIHSRMLILECSQGCYAVKIWPCDIDLWPMTLKINSVLDCCAVKMWPLDLWPWKSIRFQTLLRTKYGPSLVKIHWRILILDCSQGWYAVNIWPGDLDRCPWKSIWFQILLRTKCVPSLVKIHWKMLILECSQECCAVKIRPCDIDLWHMTLKINRVPNPPKD